MLGDLINWLVFSILQFDPDSRLGAGIKFFLYDSLKILLLLFCMVSLIGFLRTFLPENKLKVWLEGKGLLGNFLASLFGALTPFCSCSSIPIFLGFVKSGIPLGVTFSFLITSPLINEYLVILMIGFFGLKITIFYVLSGILIGVTSGLILGRMGLEKFISKDLMDSGNLNSCKCLNYKRATDRILFGFTEAKVIVKKLWPWIVLGVGIGAFIHNYIPNETIQSIITKTGIFSVPIATALGVPMYGNCAAIVPIAVVLFRKGIPLGTALAFMMATAALSLPEATILKRAMKLRLIIIFFGTTALAIVFTGYLFNLLERLLV